MKFIKNIASAVTNPKTIAEAVIAPIKVPTQSAIGAIGGIPKGPEGVVAGAINPVKDAVATITGGMTEEEKKKAALAAALGGLTAQAPQAAPSLEGVERVTLERLGTAEEQAQRAKLARDLMIQQQAAQRQLAAQQARSGIRGGSASSQQARLVQQIAQQRAVQEEQGALERRMFNLQQAQKEQFANVASQLALKQMATSLEGQRAIAQAAREGAAVQAQIAGQKSGGGFLGIGGGKVICTELHRQGLLDDATFEADQEFGKFMRETYPQVMIGYWTLALPVVALMQKSKLFTYLVSLIAKPWAKHMAYLMGVREKDHFVGRLIMTVGKPLCVAASRGKKVYG